MLQQVMGISDDALAELMLCGGFGNYINIASAVKIRLLPDLPLEAHHRTWATPAAIGAQMRCCPRPSGCARSISRRNRARRARRAQEFQDIFVEGMNFSGTPVHRRERRRQPPEAPRAGSVPVSGCAST
jgi:uncharacterized 2Fe-2S/4Fe-4S cluster protein (DUF4445 family)